MAIKRKSHEVGIKELKDHASEIISNVINLKRTYRITKNDREVARLSPVIPETEQDPIQAMQDESFLIQPARNRLKDIELIGLAGQADEAIKAILRERKTRN